MTAKVTYFPPTPDDADEVDMFGVHFKAEKAVEVSDDTAIRLMGNPYFEIDKIPDSPAEVKKPRGRPRAGGEAEGEEEPKAEAPAPIPGPKPGEAAPGTASS